MQLGESRTNCLPDVTETGVFSYFRQVQFLPDGSIRREILLYVTELITVHTGIMLQKKETIAWYQKSRYNTSERVSGELFVDVEWVSRITARNALIRQNFTAFIVTTQNSIKQREKDKKKSLKEQGLLIASEYKKKLEEFTFSLRITAPSNNDQHKWSIFIFYYFVFSVKSETINPENSWHQYSCL